MEINAIWEFLKEIVSVNQAMTLVALILANLLLGTAAAIKNGEFEIARFKDFIRRAGYVFVAYVGMAIVAVVLAEYQPIRDVTWGALIAFLGTQIVDNLRALGLKVPETLANLVERKEKEL